jgi:diguanylate cyclase (GGDEF)-like protein/PAS domain S-box-containing protein
MATGSYHPSPLKEWGVGISVFILAAIVSTDAIWHLEKMRAEAIKHRINELANENIFRLDKDIDQIMALSYPIASTVREDGSIDDFDFIAEKLIAHYPLISEIALAPGGIIEHVVPLRGNEKAVGFNLLTDPEQQAEALLARESGKLTLAGPLHLVQGGEGIVARMPLFRGKEKKFWGFVFILIRFPDILHADSLNNLTRHGYRYTLTRIHPNTRKEQIIAASDNQALDHPIEKVIKLPNALWTLRIAPAEGWYNRSLLALETALGVLVSILLGYIAKQYAELRNHRHFLEKRVEERTAEIAETKNQLRTLLDTIPDLIWLKNSDGIYLLCNPMFERFFGAAEEEIVGKSDYDFVDKELADFFLQKDLQAMETDGPSINEEWVTFADDGHRAFLETIKTPMVDETGALVGVLGIARDITQRHTSKINLLHTEKLLEEMSAMAHVGGWEFDPKSGGGSWTAETARIHGMDPEDATNTTIGLSVYEGAWLEKIETAIDNAITKALPYDLELQMTTPAGEKKWVRTIGIPVVEKGKVVRVRGSMQDITAQKSAEEKIHWLAHFDPLTKLPNRTLLNDRVDYAIRIAHRSQDTAALLYLDLDHFKNINETLGHHIGDELIVQVASRIRSLVREADTLSRQGGDEFLIFLSGTDSDGAAHVAEKLIESLSQPYQIQHHELSITPSIGIALYPTDGADFTALSQSADAAMYRAKEDGRNCYRFFTPEIQARTARTLELENALRHALSRNELELCYQPQISLETGRLVGAEALLRWNHPTLGMVSPSEFIPVAEESGQIIAIGEWVLRRALGQLKSWMDGGMEPFIMAVNLSAIQFRHPKLVSLVLEILEEVRLSARYLELELTERIASENPLQAIDIMNELYDQGIRMSIDDFGTGYSSLNYLKKFRVYKLKIDQSFIHDITDNPEDRTIVNTIINMAHSLNMITIAEGVETAGQLELLRQSGCNEIQGYYFSQPLPADLFERFVHSRESGVVDSAGRTKP